jgi:hypothetical protein
MLGDSIKRVAVGIAALGGAAALAAGTATAAASPARVAAPTSATTARSAATTQSTTAAAKADGLAIRRVAVPASAVPAQVKASLSRADAAADTTVYLYMFVNDADGLCLDANNAGSTAGTNGDKVQLWTCNGTDNQVWYGYDITEGYVDLVNDEYQNECLNAVDTGGLADGRHVQLWACSVDTSNMFWYQSGAYIFLDDDAPDYVLDATSQDLGNGDQIQIWGFLGGTNQQWEANPTVL